MDKKIQQEFILLSDKPATQDRFGSQSYSRAAKALASSVKRLTDQDGAIGLEGDWGSGKSSVINFAQKELECDGDESKYNLFYFDLWAHGNEDIRRPILEEFIIWAGKYFKLPSEKCDYFLDRVKGRTEVIKHQKTRSYSLLAVAGLLLLPLFPLIIAWMSPFAYNPAIKDISYIPFTAVLASSICYLMVFWYAFRKGSLKEAVSFFDKESYEENLTRSISKSDPITVEFHSVFRELLQLIQSENKRVVLVLDNIDRLPQDRVQSIWAEVRSIFSAWKAGEDEPKGSSAVTVIIPYDVKYVISAFSGKHNLSQGGQLVSQANSLIRKTFRSVIRVSPPISTDWKDFFYENISQAFIPNLDSDTRFRLFRLLDLHYKNEGRYPTPREIITHINELVVLSEQWFEHIKIEAISLFVIHREALLESTSSLHEHGVVDQRMIAASELGDSWRKQIASLLYNVELNDAEQVFLGLPIERALTKPKSHDELSKLSQHKAFAEILGDVINKNADEWSQEDPLTLSKVAHEISKIDLPDVTNKNCWNTLASAINFSGTIKIDDNRNIEGLLLIIENSSDISRQALALRIRTSVNSGLDNDSESRTYENGLRWLEALGQVAQTLKKLEGNSAFENFVSSTVVPLGVECALGVAAGCYRNSHLGIKYDSFNNPNKDEELSAHLETLIKDSPKKFSDVIHAEPNFLKEKTASLIEHSIRTLSTTPENSLSNRLDLVRAITKLDSIQKSNSSSPGLNTFVDNGSVFWHFSDALKENNHILIAHLLWIILRAKESNIQIPNPTKHPVFGAIGNRHAEYSEFIVSENYSDEFLDEFCRLVERSNRFSELQTYCVVNSPLKIFARIYTKLVARGRFNSMVTGDIPKHYLRIKETLEDKLTQVLLKKYANWIDSIKKTFEGDKCFTVGIEFLQDIKKWNIKDLNFVYELISKEFDSYSKDEWFSLLTNPTDKYEYFLLMVKNQNYEPPVQAFREALVEHAKACLIGNIDSSSVADDWEAIISALKQNTREAFVADTQNLMSSITVTSEGATCFVKFYRPIFERLLKIASGKDAFAEQILTRLISTASQEVQTLTNKFSVQLFDYYQGLSDTAKAMVEEAIDDLDRAEDGTKKELADELRKTLKLIKPKKNKDSAKKEK